MIKLSGNMFGKSALMHVMCGDGVNTLKDSPNDMVEKCRDKMTKNPFPVQIKVDAKNFVRQMVQGWNR
eukprot:8093872-Heterocapsa_arctica.AAC.1